MPDAGVSNQAKASLRAVSDNLRKALGEDLDALRAAMDERAKALDATIAHTDTLLDQVVRELSEAADAEADRAARQARTEAEQVAQQTLDAVRLHAQEELAAQCARLEAARATLEAQLAAAQARQAETASALADAQHEIEAARRAWADQGSRLDETHRRIRELEEDHAQWTLARQVAEAHLEEERQRRKTIAVQLESLQEELRLARAEAKSFQLEAQHLGERIHRLATTTVRESNGQSPSPGTDVRGAMLDNLRNALNALADAQTADAILASLLESLSGHFVTVALYVVGPGGLTRWRSLGADRDEAAQFATIPLDSDFVAARAVRDQAVLIDHAVAWNRAVNSSGKTAKAAAVPVVANERVIAVAYVEHPQDRAETDVALYTRMAEVLTDRVNQRLRRAPSITRVPPDRLLGPAAETNPPTPDNESARYVLARQARRVPISDGVTVLLNGVASALVDLSTLGAQVVSPSAVYPNRSVRIVLPRDEGDLSCKARIVWARIEQQQDEAAVRYRAGLEFTEADKAAVQVFVTKHGTVHMSPAPSTMH
jgi:hypothetical protein